MREIGGSILRYTPAAVPSGSVNDYLRDELAKIASVLSQVMDGQVDVTTVEPAKPRDGMIRLADGVTFNPGSGRGFYGYSNGAWRFLG